MEEYYLALIAIRGKLLRVFAKSEGNGVNFDPDEMAHLMKEEDPLPGTYLLLENINPESKLEGTATYLLKGFTEKAVTIRSNEARELTTLGGEKIIIGFNNLKRQKY